MQDKIHFLPLREPVGPERGSPNNLPAQLTPLIGREQEVGATCLLLRRPNVRLITLTGTGGIGKTRLALQVATDLLEDFPDGVSFVNLAPISDPDLVMPTTGQILGLREVAGHSFLDLLKAALRDKHLLLVLDNFEQVLSAAPQLTALLSACADLKLLVTSRAVLHVQGEYEFPVSPLAMPDLKQLPEPESLSRYAAVTLFLQRAQAVKPTFQLTASTARAIAEICVHLEGLPLAIELAAARMKLLPPQALLARLEHRLQVLTGGTQDAPIRQQTLRNTIDWSYQLLNAQEQRLFRQLSIFAGSCTLEAIEAVSCACGTGELSVLEGVASLLDKSLLRQTEPEGGEPRLVMLETIREYGLEMLTASGEVESARQAHAVYYLKLAEAAEPELRNPQQGVWFDRLEREHDNLRAAMNWLLEQGDAELPLRLGAALWWFWLNSGYFSEGWNFLERALERSGEVAVPVRANALWAAGNLAGFVGHFELGEVLCKESLALFRRIGDTKGIGQAVFHLAEVAFARYNFAAARTLFEESLTLSREAGDKTYWAYALAELATVAVIQGEYARVEPLVQEGLTLFGELGDTGGIAYSLTVLATLMFVQGDLARAHALAEECLTLVREAGTKRSEADALALLGEITLHQGDTTTARMLIEQSCALWQEIGNEEYIAWGFARLGRVIAAQDDHTAAQALYEKSLIRRKGVYSNIASLDIVPEGLAAIVAARGEPTWAARLWGAAEALRDAMGTPIPPIQRTDYERSVAAARTQLGEQAFAAAWAEGRSMPWEQVLAAREPLWPPSETHLPPPGTSSTYPDGLTVREVEVLRLVAQGLSNAEIAEQLVISLLTVKAHMRSLYNKLGISSRSAATRYAIEHHLI